MEIVVLRIKEPFILGFLGAIFQSQRTCSLVLVLLGGDFSEAKNLQTQFLQKKPQRTGRFREITGTKPAEGDLNGS
jgi:hypothetical protein